MVLFSVKLVRIKIHSTETPKLLLIFTSHGFIAVFYVNTFLEEHR